MGRRIDRTADPEWEALFRGFTHSAFRLETLQSYAEPEEAEDFARFLAGEPPDMDLSWWDSVMHPHKAAGHRMSRVRIVVEPLTDYTRYEFVYYPVMNAGGEEIRIIPVSEGTWPEGLPHEDYWLIDERDVWVIEYDEKGTFLGADLLDSDPGVLAQHLRWRDIALAQAIPVNEYLANAARHNPEVP